MILVTDPREMRQRVDDARREGREIAFVPTMGALHAGHCALVRRALEFGDLVVVSVFVNPTQFGRGEDFTRYPRDLEHDAMMAADAGADVLFAPSADAMYPYGFVTHVDVERITTVLEGKARPGHFRGVATVVAKLVNIVRPDVMLLGQKDAQQVVVIRRMLEDLNTGVATVVVPTVREADGLALSSRNVYLTPEQRAAAPVLLRALTAVEDGVRAGERSGDHLRSLMVSMIAAGPQASIDYVSVADADTLEELVHLISGQHVLASLAVRFGTTRLIDNVTFTV